MSNQHSIFVLINVQLDRYVTANSMQHACWLKEHSLPSFLLLGGSSLPPLICQICCTQPQLLVLINSQPCPPGQALPAPVAISQGKAQRRVVDQQRRARTSGSSGAAGASVDPAMV